MIKCYNELTEKIAPKRILLNEPMSKHTSFKIGGPADMLVIINNLEELKYAVEISKKYKLPITCIGNGSNLLVKDKGIRGVTIKLNLKGIEINNEEIQVEAGVPLPILARTAYENNLSGLEFAYGIPGTVGGAVKMNAGAYGGEFGDIVVIRFKFFYINIKLNFFLGGGIWRIFWNFKPVFKIILIAII